MGLGLGYLAFLGPEVLLNDVKRFVVGEDETATEDLNVVDFELRVFRPYFLDEKALQLLD